MTVHGAVVAGGAASRYGGRPKGLLDVGGRRILDRVVESLQAATGESPTIIANAGDAQAWRPDLRVVPDVLPGRGS
ncbi:MAG TPA: NTP transferase domain-containing protein, partial [Gemmatimonadales bacterium]|nr:NTP transferase domain-containing protein [Gemmatimonadales bacterium]